MERSPVVALGQKDRVSPSLGQRLQSHFYNNRGAYLAAAGVAGAGAAAYLGHRSGLEKADARVARLEASHTDDRRQAYLAGRGEATHEMISQGFGARPAFAPDSAFQRALRAHR